jgi:diadenosine tetraphosphatase ApaH/serine/threonine PP2A family protein phosphatase
MAKTALISDIHGNLEALEAVLREIRHLGIDEIWCLGDVVGYGPDPVQCTDLVTRNCSLALMGNHDWALLNSPIGFNSLATAMIYKTKEWMRVSDSSDATARKRWDFLSQLPLSAEVDSAFLVHGSPRAELSEYILPSDVSYDPDKFEEIFSMIEHACFVGHSHIPCWITEGLTLALPREDDTVVDLKQISKCIINIGSVGQPRDGDNRACFVTIEDGVVQYRRVPYDYHRTSAKIKDLGGEYEMLGYRLSLGR